jgi:hypothetical protein
MESGDEVNASRRSEIEELSERREKRRLRVGEP